MEAQPDDTRTLHLFGPKDRLALATLMEPANSGYLLSALEIDRRPPVGFIFESQQKRGIPSRLRIIANGLKNENTVLDATAFKAIMIPPGQGALLRRRPMQTLPNLM